MHLGHPGGQHGFDLFFLAVEDALAGSFRPAQFYALGLLPGKGFPGALADELAFYFCGDAESEGKHLAGDVVAQTVVVFDCPDLCADFHAVIEYGHDHEEGAAKAADFRTDDDVVFPHTFQQLAQAALVHLFGAADGLADPFVHLQVVFLAESFDFVALVLDRLSVGAYANISVYHFCAEDTKSTDTPCQPNPARVLLPDSFRTYLCLKKVVWSYKSSSNRISPKT